MQEIYTYVKISFLHRGSTVVVQHENRGTWMHGTIARHGLEDHNKRCCKSKVMKTRQVNKGAKLHVTVIPLSAEDYLWNQRMKTNGQPIDENVSEIFGRCIRSHNNEDSNNTETGIKDVKI